MTSSAASKEIRSLASSAASLRVRKDEHAALKGMYLGALHSLNRAADLGFADRTGPAISRRYRAELSLALRRLAAAKPPLSGQWLAGFYFNDGLFRLAALYERALATATEAGGRPNIQCLRDLAVAKGLMLAAEFLTLDKVRQDVNNLKHHRDGLLLKGRKVNLELGVAAAREAEQLLRRTI